MAGSVRREEILVPEEGYAALAASYTEQEREEHRAETRSRRARLSTLALSRM